MYNNIGRKIKGLAEMVFILGVVIALLIGILLVSMGIDNDIYSLVLVGVLVVIVLSAIAYVGSMFVYGFGELIENTAAIEKNTRKNDTQDNNNVVEKQEMSHSDKLDRILSKS